MAVAMIDGGHSIAIVSEEHLSDHFI